MKLSDYVRENGIDPFTREDFAFVGGKLATNPSRLVLVGGQAIEVWGIYFDVLAPSGEHEPLTEDTDWYGSKDDAQWLCGLLGGKQYTELIIAKDFDPSPNSALAYIKRPDGRVLLMDFLRTVMGLSEEQIVRFAVSISVGGVNLNVLHPIYCLESRLANLKNIPSKRNTNGVMQANWAVKIMEAYLMNLASSQDVEGKNRELIKTCSSIAEAAEFRSGPYCFQTFRVDPLEAVSPRVLDAIGGRFVTDDWPRRVARIQVRREKAAKQFLSYTIQMGASGPVAKRGER
ncbi:MAG: hypothetical protein EON92_00400 [Burkholderiales bacterium]|nr:MAG: hypothetical protein EON92_00400 [Burkholderiales bacterium]